jgi:ComF family protein
VAAALRRLKYEERPDLARPLGHLLRRAARDADLGADVVVPVPLHPRRLADRGFNQAALLAAEVAEELQVPLVTRALARGRDTAQQAMLDRAGRLENLTGAFSALNAASIRGRRVVLIDDVMTTGATLTACAEALLGAGAGSVAGLVVARSDGRSDGKPG